MQFLKSVLQERVFVTSKEAAFYSGEGERQSWMFDFRRVLLQSDVLDALSIEMYARVAPYGKVQVGGLETASLPLIAGVVLKAHDAGTNMNGFFMRKSRDKDGMQNMIEGVVTDEPVVLLDDLVNSGKGMLRQIAALEERGMEVRAICVVLRLRDDSFYELFREKGIEVHSLFSIEDFPDAHPPIPVSKPVGELSVFESTWKFASPDPNYFYVIPKSAPVLDDTKLYFGSDSGMFWALDQESGEVVWKYLIQFGDGHKRIFSSPALSKKLGLVYFGAYDGNLYALKTRDGSRAWVSMEADWVGSSPAVSEKFGLVYVGLEFGLWNKRGGLLAVNAETGKKVWQQTMNGLVHSSPSVSEKLSVVVCGSNSGTVYGFDAKTGSQLWEFATQDAVRAGFSFDESAGTVCFGSFDKHLYILNAKTGALVHAVELPEAVYSNPLAHEGTVYVASLDKKFYAIGAATGIIRWKFRTMGRIFASPAIIGSSVYIGSNDGRMYELDAKTGEERGFFQAAERIVNVIAYNPTTHAIFLPTFANEIYRIQKKRSA